MNIIGILINALPIHCTEIAKLLPNLDVEVHAISEQGQIIATLEHKSDDVITDTLTQIQAINGVLSATMIYHHIDLTEE